MNTSKGKTSKRLLGVLAAALSLFAFTERAEAQEILLTGPLAGAPAVRKLRLYREGRFEFAPTVSFTLLDEYQRTILLGARLGYNFTDWLGIGVWGAYGGVLQMPTALTEHIQDVNTQRRTSAGDGYERSLTGLLTDTNLGTDFKKQVALIDWAVSPQITVVPLRGKIALFQSIYIDTDLYVFGGPAFVGLKERKDCERGTCGGSFERVSRTAIAPTFGLGLSFYANSWGGLGLEYRALPFSWNTGGFDTAGSGKDEKFPDERISSADRQFKFNQLLSVSYTIFLPTQFRISE
ncbi:MAG TPA: hypothetical protein VFQ61_23770 [Polyangiaceae bacterium]|nr:hypothetical protein [Polyangiaceae bacterium]